MKNMRAFKVTYLPATDNKGLRLKITDVRNKVSVIVPRTYNTYSGLADCVEFLKDKGIHICTNFELDGTHDILLSDNFETQIK